MMACEVCDLSKDKKYLIFEDDSVSLVFSPTPCSAGHMLVIPKAHAPILETLDEDTVHKMFNFANMASVCAFESFGALGTNLLIQNGVPAGQSENHCYIHIIPRYENDGLDFNWETKQMDAQQLEDTFSRFSREDTEEPVDKGDVSEGKEDYRLTFRRIP